MAETASLHTVELVAMVIFLLVLAAATFALSKRIRLPFTVLLVLIGMVLAELGRWRPGEFGMFAAFRLSPEVILFVFLPTLIFESAFHLDPRQLRHNLVPILTLAIPGVLISSAVIGLMVWALLGVEPAAALLLGAILSATDPVAVIALFKQLGAPARLTMLVEGESLFNDATAIVLSQIVLVVISAGTVTGDLLIQGVSGFFSVFLGGVAVGWLLALLAGALLQRVENEPFIEISLVTALAYCSFLIAEHLFHVSGVMATVAAAITMGGWGRTKVSPSVRDYMAHFWSYLSEVANALLFLLVGLQIHAEQLLSHGPELGWLVLAMLLSRYLVIYGLLPVVGRVQRSHVVNWRYKAVLFWGGMRGAIALAIVLSLTGLAQAEHFVVLVGGAVLFTVLVPGLSIEPLMHHLGLDRSPLPERLAQSEARLAAKHHALERIPDLEAGGWFSATVMRRLRAQYRSEVEQTKHELEQLRSSELSPEQERRLVFLKSLAVEQRFYYEMFSRGLLSEHAYRDLSYAIEVQSDAMRHDGRIPGATLHPHWRERVFYGLYWLLIHVLHLPGAAQRLLEGKTARDYETVRGRLQSAPSVMRALDELAAEDPARQVTIEAVRSRYEQWLQASRRRLDELAERYPEFVSYMQERLAQRMLVHAQLEAVEEQLQAGEITEAVASAIFSDVRQRIHELRETPASRIELEPLQLLHNVPTFQQLPREQLQPLVRRLKPMSFKAGQDLVGQDELPDALYLIARGVARLKRVTEEGETELASLFAGDFFGEMALLQLTPSTTVVCRAETACTVYRLSAADLDAVCAQHPLLLDHILKARHG